MPLLSVRTMDPMILTRALSPLTFFIFFKGRNQLYLEFGADRQGMIRPEKSAACRDFLVKSSIASWSRSSPSMETRPRSWRLSLSIALFSFIAILTPLLLEGQRLFP